MPRSRCEAGRSGAGRLRHHRAEVRTPPKVAYRTQRRRTASPRRAVHMAACVVSGTIAGAQRHRSQGRFANRPTTPRDVRDANLAMGTRVCAIVSRGTAVLWGTGCFACGFLQATGLRWISVNLLRSVHSG